MAPTIQYFSVNDKRIILLSGQSFILSYTCCSVIALLPSHAHLTPILFVETLQCIIQALIPSPIFSPYADKTIYMYSNHTLASHIISSIIYIPKTPPHDHNDRNDHPNPCRNVFIFNISFRKCLSPGLMFVCIGLCCMNIHNKA